MEIQSPVFGNEHLEKKLHEVYPNTDIRIIDTSDNSQDYLAMAAVHFFVSKFNHQTLLVSAGAMLFPDLSTQ